MTEFVEFDLSRCEACGKCAEACKSGVLGMIRLPFHKHAVVKKPDLCRGCRKCVRSCPQEAIRALPK